MSTALMEFLAADDLDDLADAASRLGVLEHADQELLGDLLARMDDTQEMANLLMHPRLVPAEQRAAVLVRAMSAPLTSYLRLAAAVGAGDLSELDYTATSRPALIDALLDLVADNRGVVASRAAISVGPLLSAEDAPDVIVLLDHPSADVRHNLHNALLDLLGPAAFDRLLEDRDVVPDELALNVRDRLTGDGRLGQPMLDIQRMPLLAWIPNRCEWSGIHGGVEHAALRDD